MKKARESESSSEATPMSEVASAKFSPKQWFAFAETEIRWLSSKSCRDEKAQFAGSGR